MFMCAQDFLVFDLSLLCCFLCSDSYGFALDNGYPQLLLPGRHVRDSAVWKFQKYVAQVDYVIEFNSISLITVAAGKKLRPI